MIIKSKTPENKHPYTPEQKAKIIASIEKLTLTKNTDFVNVRQDAQFSNLDFPDGWVHQIALDEGYEVEP